MRETLSSALTLVVSIACRLGQSGSRGSVDEVSVNDVAPCETLRPGGKDDNALHVNGCADGLRYLTVGAVGDVLQEAGVRLCNGLEMRACR